MRSNTAANRSPSYHTANAMDNALPTANKGNFGEAIGYSDTRRYHQTMVDLTPTHRRWNTQPLKRRIPHLNSELNKKQCESNLYRLRPNCSKRKRLGFRPKGSFDKTVLLKN